MLCTSGFVDDVMFSHNGANGPKSSTTLFRRVRQVAAPRTKSDIDDCFLPGTGFSVVVRHDSFVDFGEIKIVFAYLTSFLTAARESVKQYIHTYIHTSKFI